MDTSDYIVLGNTLYVNLVCLYRKDGLRKYSHLIKQFNQIEFYGSNNPDNIETMFNVLTKNTYRVKYSLSYRGPIKLSKNIIHVCTGLSYDQSQPLVLTKKLLYKHFDMESSFNNPIQLSKNLKEIHFGKFFNQLLYLPKWIQCLKIAYVSKYNKLFIPTKYLKNVLLCEGFIQKYIYFFDGIKHIRVSSDNDYILDNLPEKICDISLLSHSSYQKPIISIKTNVPRKCIITRF